jgi:N-ethylmaleimide reductase
MSEKAFTPITVAGHELKNRIVMAPMTRSRAQEPGALATEMMATYYAQRASAGFIVTEGIQPSVVGQGYAFTPGLHSADQVASWRQVTDAVHAEGGVIFAQLMHCGRIGHADLHADGSTPQAPSAVAAQGEVYTATGLQPLPTPEAMTEADIAQTIADFANAAKNAIEAGFDGVEIHGANGYVVHQFLSDNVNVRTDEWGGSVAGHIKFAVEVTKAVAAAIGENKTAIRVSPANPFNGIEESNVVETYTALITALAPLNLAYLHFSKNPMQGDFLTDVRALWPHVLVVNDYVADRAKGKGDLHFIDDNLADLVSFGQQFLANPDLPARLATDGPYNTPNPATFYGGTAVGYIDYPTL